VELPDHAHHAHRPQGARHGRPRQRRFPDVLRLRDHGLFLGRCKPPSLRKSWIKGGAEQPEFYQAKLQTAEFYFERLLPRAKGHVAGIIASPKSLMQMKNDAFAME
jgi:hypothetical protein